MTATLELDFNTPWERQEGRILRWRRAEPKQYFMGLRVRLEEKRGESVEMEFPPGTHPATILADLGRMRAEFLARPRIRGHRTGPTPSRDGNGGQSSAA